MRLTVESPGVSWGSMLKFMIFMVQLLLLSTTLLAAEDYSYLLNSASMEYQRLNFESAEKVYRTILEKVPPEDLSNRAARFEALVGLALIEHSKENEKGSIDLLEEAAGIAGWKSLEERDYPPSFLLRYSRIRQNINSASALAITTSPPYAKLKIQGFEAGESPITLNRLPAGRYHVEASMDGYTPISETVELSEGSNRLLQLDLNNRGREENGLTVTEPQDSLYTPPPIKKEKSKFWEHSWVGAALLAVGSGVAVYYIAKDKPDKGAAALDLP